MATPVVVQGTAVPSSSAYSASPYDHHKEQPIEDPDAYTTNNNTSAPADIEGVGTKQPTRCNDPIFAILLIGNIAAMSEGVVLSAADTIVFVECTWSTSALEQASSRVENINKSGIPPVIYILTIKASLDHTVLAKVLKKLHIGNQII